MLYFILKVALLFCVLILGLLYCILIIGILFYIFKWCTRKSNVLYIMCELLSWSLKNKKNDNLLALKENDFFLFNSYKSGNFLFVYFETAVRGEFHLNALSHPWKELEDTFSGLVIKNDWYVLMEVFMLLNPVINCCIFCYFVLGLYCYSTIIMKITFCFHFLWLNLFFNLEFFISIIHHLTHTLNY